MATEFEIPNLASATFPQQSEPDNVDFKILAQRNVSGVISGCAVTAQASPNMTVHVASGSIRVNGSAAIAVTAGDVTILTADSQMRFDLVVVNNSGTKSVVKGTAGTNPVFPAIPASSVVLAAVCVPANATSIPNTYIIGKQTPIEAPAGGAVTVDTFTAGGTWSKPGGAVMCEIIVIAPGGGGGSGRRGSSGSSSGGGGGAGGTMARRLMPASALGATETVTIGAVGTSGAVQTVDNTDGNAGGAGGTTSFGTHVSCAGGGGGLGGTTTGIGTGGAAVTAANTALQAFESVRGSAGGSGGTGTGNVGVASPDSTGTSAGMYLTKGPSGGGGGGGGNSAIAQTGGAGGQCWNKAGGTGGTGAVGNAGGASAANEPNPGAGGGGGGGTAAGAGRAGANGSIYGGGGGGGSGSVNGQNSGAGGTGGAGLIVVITYGT